MNLSLLIDRLPRLLGRRWRLMPAALVIAAALVFSACDLVGGDEEDEQQQAQQQAEQQDTAAPAAAPTRPAATPPPADPGPEPPPSADGGGAGADAYSIVFPSIAYVSAGDAVATGLVTDTGLIVVDAQALYGATAANVLLSNGESFEAVPLIGVDQLTGLAFLGPLDIAVVRLLPGARLADGENIGRGSDVYAIGYDFTDAPGDHPSVLPGVLSGFDEWEAGERTLLRANVPPPGVGTGAVLVDARGAVIGLATVSISTYGWYVSAGDIARSLPPMPPAPTHLPDPESATTDHTLTVPWGQPAATLFLSDDATNEVVSLSISASVASSLHVFDAQGVEIESTDLIAGSTIITMSPNTVGPYRLAFVPQPPSADEPFDLDDDHGHEPDDDHGHEAMDDDHGHDMDDDHGHDMDDDHGHDMDDDHGHDDEAMDDELVEEMHDEDMHDHDMSEALPLEPVFEISASVPLMATFEADSRAPLHVNEAFIGTIHALDDVDAFVLRARAGDVFEISAESLQFIAELDVNATGAATIEPSLDAGPFDYNAKLTLTVIEDSIIDLSVSALDGWGTGAYVLLVNQVAGEPQEAAADAAPTRPSGDAMAMTMLPAPSPPPAVSLRGVGSDEGLQATLLGIGSEAKGDALIIDDLDGRFEITVSAIGVDGALGRLTVTNSIGDAVVEGSILVTCAGAGECLARAIFVASENAAGPWTAQLSADAPGISEWQIEAVLND